MLLFEPSLLKRQSFSSKGYRMAFDAENAFYILGPKSQLRY